MGALPAGVGVGLGLLFLFIFGVIIGGFFMWIAAKIARVEKSTFGRAMVAALASSFVTVLIFIFAGLMPVIGDVLGFIIGLIASMVIIKGIFDTNYGKAARSEDIPVDSGCGLSGAGLCAHKVDSCFVGYLSESRSCDR